MTADPRVRRTKALVHEAAIAVLVEEGFTGVSIESIAQRAGVARTTIYRHWSSPAAIVIDAFDSLSEPFELEPSGDVRTDLVTVLGRLATDLPESRWASVLTALVAAAEHDPELAERKRALAESRRRATMSLIEDAARRGEIRADVDSELVAAMLAGPLFYRRLLTNEPVDRQLVETIVDVVLAGLDHRSAGAARARSAARPRR